MICLLTNGERGILIIKSMHMFLWRRQILLSIHQSVFFFGSWEDRKMKCPYTLWSGWGHMTDFWPVEPMNATSRLQKPLLNPSNTSFPLDGSLRGHRVKLAMSKARRVLLLWMTTWNRAPPPLPLDSDLSEQQTFIVYITEMVVISITLSWLIPLVFIFIYVSFCKWGLDQYLLPYFTYVQHIRSQIVSSIGVYFDFFF